MVVSCASLYHTAGLPGRFITYVSVMLHVTLCTRGSSFRYVLLTRGRPVAGAFCVTQLQHPRSLFLHSPLPMPVVALNPPTLACSGVRGEVRQDSCRPFGHSWGQRGWACVVAGRPRPRPMAAGQAPLSTNPSPEFIT